MNVYQAEIKTADSGVHGSEKPTYSALNSVDRYIVTDKTIPEVKKMLKESHKHCRVLIKGGPARKIRATDFRIRIAN